MRSIFRVAAVLAAATIPIVGLSTGPAVAKPKPKATPQILVTCSPNPVVETSTSNVLVVCQVEANPGDAGSFVTVSSTQLSAHCPGGIFGAPAYQSMTHAQVGSTTMPLDNDGNLTIWINGEDCAPGTALITADLDSPPFSTAITKLVMEPPEVTPPGVKGYPANEVEVGDALHPQGTQANEDSEAIVVFYVETNPVYAEQTAQITSDQLTERCGQGYAWFGSALNLLQTDLPPVPAPGGVSGVVVASSIDNDGNVAFLFDGISCAAGKSTVIAEILNGGPTYSTQYNILPPAVTI